MNLDKQNERQECKAKRSKFLGFGVWGGGVNLDKQNEGQEGKAKRSQTKRTQAKAKQRAELL